jgi:hypothetical protein
LENRVSKSRNTTKRTSIHLKEAAERFGAPDPVGEISPFGSGNVNDTFLVASGANEKGSFILQRINAGVFNMPEWIMQNLRIFSAHVSKRLGAMQSLGRRWEMVRFLHTKEAKDYWIDPQGNFWRAMSLIEEATSFDSIAGLGHAAEIGFALGLFHSLVKDLAPEVLKDTLEGFHITPLYLRRYEAVRAALHVPASADTAFCIDFIEKRKDFVTVLEDARGEGRLVLRIIHGDPKVGNVLIDTRTNLAVSIVDLDTVKPGLVHYDIGDALRSCCNPAGEDPFSLEEVRFEPELCRALLGGYWGVVKDFLAPSERKLLYASVRLISFELGLRFFTDFLEGNLYFTVTDSTQNLRRALVQFRLCQSIESQEKVLQKLIDQAAWRT